MHAKREKLTRCLSCEYPLRGKIFCANCGQRNLRRRLRWRDVYRDVNEQLLEWNLPWLRTVRALLLRPGATCREFLDGKRVVYVNPLKYALYAIVIFSVLQNTFLATADPFEAAKQLPAWKVFLRENVAIFALLVSPFMVATLRTLFWKHSFNSIEISVFVFYMLGQGAILLLLVEILLRFVPLLKALVPAFAVTLMLSFLLYFAAAVSRFFAARLDWSLAATLATFAFSGYVALEGWYWLHVH